MKESPKSHGRQDANARRSVLPAVAAVPRKVQAQRKFAQGAHIPSTSSAAPVPALARADPPPAPPNRDDRNVIQNSLSAAHLLDVVSFQNMHTHSDPIVLLERITPSIDNMDIEIISISTVTNEDRTQPATPVIQSTSFVASVHSSPAKSKPKSSSKTSAMCLRSRSSILNKSIKKVAPSKKRPRAVKFRKGKRPLVKPRRKRQVEQTPSATTSDIDDERPLQYFKKNKEPAPPQEPEAEEEARVLRPIANENKAKRRKVGKIMTRKRRKTQLLQNESGESSRAVKKKSKPPAPAADNAPTFKEPAIPTRSRRSAPQSATNTKNTNTGTAIALNSAGTEKSSHLYGSNGIERWLTDKEPEPAECMGSSRAASPCPSESLRTFRDVVQAAPGALTARCNNCRSCNRVSVVQKIVYLLNKSRCMQNRRSSDVYEFTDLDESEADQPPECLNHRRRDSQHRDSFDNEEQHIYLDLVKDSANIIQLTPVKVPNAKRLSMKGRLVNKSDARPTDDFSLVEHENLLDQLLQSLVVHISMNGVMPEDSSQHHNERPGPSRKSAPNTSDHDKPSTSSGMMTRGRAEEQNEARTSSSKSQNASKSGSEPGGKLLEAPTFYPTEAEFNDPIALFEKIAPLASKFGICKVVAPKNFKPRCVLNDSIKFNVSNHYIARLYSRWGSSARDMNAIKTYLYKHNVYFQRVPLLDGLEVNLSKLYATVQRNGGLKEVIEKKRWGRVADEMNFIKAPNTEKIVESYYLKYLLPYDTASKHERQEVVASVDRIWEKKHRKLVAWARNPLHHQKKLLGESDSSDDESPEEETRLGMMSEAEDCIAPGRLMVLSGFKRVALHAMLLYMGRENATPDQVEEAYWQLVLFGMEHVCVNAASIDTSASGFGFSRCKTDPTHKHPWNLKSFSSNSGNVLRSLGAVLGVTVPTLHLGMLFATSCWHRDPHGLPWVEYMHEGAPKIWYGIPDEQSTNFRNAVDALCPTSCQKKAIWLSSDITMIPPHLLREHRVSLSRAVQKPGEYIIVFPKAYSCSISTGYTVSESVYFATKSWLNNVHQDFQELRSSCEPTTFSLEHLLLKLAKDTRLSTAVLQQVLSELTIIVGDEIADRHALVNMGVKKQYKQHIRRSGTSAWNVLEQAECAICRATLYLSKVSGVISKKEDVCLVHALRLLQKRGDLTAEELKPVDLIIFKSEKHLEEVLNDLKKRVFAPSSSTQK